MMPNQPGIASFFPAGSPVPAPKAPPLDVPPYMTSLPTRLRGVNLAPGWRAHGPLLVWEYESPAPCASIAAFDFDGCLANTPLHGDANDWKMQFANVPRVLQGLHERGVKIVIITNESMDRFKSADAIGKCIRKKCGRLEGFCRAVGVPIQVLCATGGTSKNPDPFRKPGTAAFSWMAESANGGIAPDLERCFYVGDAAGRPGDHSDSDAIFARNIGLEFFTETRFFEEKAYERFLVG